MSSQNFEWGTVAVDQCFHREQSQLVFAFLPWFLYFSLVDPTENLTKVYIYPS